MKNKRVRNLHLFKVREITKIKAFFKYEQREKRCRSVIYFKDG
jgi:hypothetical protein